MFTALLAVLLFGITALYAGPGGLDRFEALPEKRAQGVREFFVTGAIDALVLLWAAIALVDVALGIAISSTVDIVVYTAAFVVLVSTRVMRPRAREHVLAGFARRGFAPARQRETSARRERRQRQFGAVALSGYLVSHVCLVMAPRTRAPWPGILEVPATLMLIGGGLALLWATAWRFGDERPA